MQKEKDKEDSIEEQDIEEQNEKIENPAIVIHSHDELVCFLIELLDLDENVESEDVLMENNSYRILYSLLKKIPILTIAIENKYVDRYYRDSFYLHYSCKHMQYERFCKRIFCFAGDCKIKLETFCELDIKYLQKEFIGTIVIRPLKEGKIGRSLLNPYFFCDKENTYLRYAKYDATIFGIRLKINAFPFSMQDGETTSCAEITILNLLDYFSIKYPEYKYILPSEIAEITEQNGFERNLPTKGLGYSVIAKVFCEVGFSPRLYNKNITMEMSFKRIMHYYIESGIPTAVGVKIDENTRHSIICLGHGKILNEQIKQKRYAIYDGILDDYIWLIDTADLCNDYIVMDDGQVPYEKYEWKTVHQDNLPDRHTFGAYEPDTLMVPLYKRMFLEAQDAYSVCTSTLASSEAGIKKFYPVLGTIDNPVIIRLFMASSRSVKSRRILGFSEKNQEIRQRYVDITFPKFIWVCEIYSCESYIEKKAIGEILVDATSSPYDVNNSILLIHYPKHIFINNQSVTKTTHNYDEMFDELNDWEEFEVYDHNLYQPEKL